MRRAIRTIESKGAASVHPLDQDGEGSRDGASRRVRPTQAPATQDRRESGADLQKRGAPQDMKPTYTPPQRGVPAPAAETACTRDEIPLWLARSYERSECAPYRSLEPVVETWCRTNLRTFLRPPAAVDADWEADASFIDWCRENLSIDSLRAQQRPGDVEILYIVPLSGRRLHIGYRDDRVLPEFSESELGMIYDWMEETVMEHPLVAWLSEMAEGGLDVDYYDATGRRILSFEVDPSGRFSRCANA